MLRLRPTVGADKGGEAVEAFGQDAARTRQVPAHEALALRAVHGAGVEPQARFGGQAVLERGRRQTEGAAVHPGEVGAFEAGKGKAGQVIAAVVAEVAVVGVEVGQQLVEPFAALVVGGDGGDDAEGIDVAHLVVVDGAVYAGTEGVVGTDDVGYLQSGDIEGLAG